MLMQWVCSIEEAAGRERGHQDWFERPIPLSVMLSVFFPLCLIRVTRLMVRP